MQWSLSHFALLHSRYRQRRQHILLHSGLSMNQIYLLYHFFPFALIDIKLSTDIIWNVNTLSMQSLSISRIYSNYV